MFPAPEFAAITDEPSVDGPEQMPDFATIAAQACQQIGRRALEALKAGDNANAFEMYRSAQTYQHDHPDGWMGLASLALAPDRHAAAIAINRRVVALLPDNVRAHSNLGMALHRAQLFMEAEAELTLALAIAPDDYAAVHNMALVHYATGRADLAVSGFAHALELSPGSVAVRSDYAQAVLKTGDLARGLELLEVRWEGLLAKTPIWECGLEQWRGQLTRGGTLLLHHEQGFGDTLQFVRFIPAIKAHAGADKIIFAGPQPLQRLLREQCGIDEVIDDRAAGPIVAAARRADYHCPLESAVAVLRPFYSGPSVSTSTATINSTAYLTVPSSVEEPRARFHAGGAALAVGLCWGASATPERGTQKSVPLEQLLALGAIPGVRLWSLQFGPYEADLQRTAADHLVDEVSGGLGDFANVAMIMSKLDLIVSIDTMTAHLAGALGRPVFMLNPINSCWRWVHGAKPWYASMKIFDQIEASDWKLPIDQVACVIQNMVAEKRRVVS